MRFIIDIEASNLLGPSLDYTTLPFKLKPEFKIHCIVIRHVDSEAVVSLYGAKLTKENLQHYLRKCTEIIGHNIINYDLPVLQLYGLLDYNIAYPGETSTMFGKEVKITDTLIWSKLLDPDRFGGHSLGAWGRRFGNHKGDFNDWSKFSEEMLEYCIQDTAVNRDLFLKLLEDQGEHDWSAAYAVESKLVDLTLKQEVFGFDFDMELAERNIEELSELMQAIAAKVDPLLPKKRLTKGAMAEYMLPARTLKKDGTPSTYLLKFIERIGAKLSPDNAKVIFEGKAYTLDYQGALKTEDKASIEDIDVVKGYLIDLGWEPSEVKERDIVKRTDKSVKNQKEITESIERYIEQTSSSVFRKLRLDFLGVTDEKELRKLLLEKQKAAAPQVKWNKMQAQKPIFLPTTPKLAVGVEKEICPNLVALGDKAAFVKDVVQYYTYRHRKNSIAGGTLDDDGEPVSGFVSYVREDGRIPTPADTLGANTGRYRHKIVCNVPRVTSLYGENMRAQFGAGKGLWQLGYDFASLEARIMGHYVIPFEHGVELAEALVAEKPNDIHSLNARKLGIDRSAAKSFSYAAIYGAQPTKLSKMLGITQDEGKRLFNEYWDAVPALKELKAEVEREWEQRGKKHILGLDGRLLNTRSKHSLINVLFQSGGAIAAKWSAVYLAQEMEQLGILGDPFKDTLKDQKVWWLIHMHDEQQMACHPSLLDVRGMSEEEAKIFVKENKGCSAIGHGSKGAYVGLKTKPIDCIEKGIQRACQYLKLNVDLGFEYIPGKTWAQCH
jgi:DNA polymerase family A